MTEKTPRKTRYCLGVTPQSLFIVLSGPSGVGKDAVLNRLKETGFPIKRITTVTTRSKRAQELDGLDYCFISSEEFQALRVRNELLESANVYGNWYGVPKQPVREALASGQDAIVRIDVQGAATLKRILPDAVFIFLAPESVADLVTRLNVRKTESSGDLALRLATAEQEMKQVSLFDYVVCNRRDEIDQAVADIEHIIRAEKCRVHPREIHI